MFSSDFFLRLPAYPEGSARGRGAPDLENPVNNLRAQ